MNDLISSIGVPAIVVILLLREIIPALKNNNNKEDESKSVSQDDLERLKKTVQYKDTCSEIVKRMDGRFDTVDSGIKEVKALIKNGNK